MLRCIYYYFQTCLTQRNMRNLTFCNSANSFLETLLDCFRCLAIGCPFSPNSAAVTFRFRRIHFLHYFSSNQSWMRVAQCRCCFGHRNEQRRLKTFANRPATSAAGTRLLVTLPGHVLWQTSEIYGNLGTSFSSQKSFYFSFRR